MTKLADREDIPVLKGGWINFTEAAERLGWTRSYMYKKASKPAKEGGFKTVHRIGAQPTFVINESEIEEIIASQPDRLVAEPDLLAEPEVELSLEAILNKI